MVVQFTEQNRIEQNRIEQVRKEQNRIGYDEKGQNRIRQNTILHNRTENVLVEFRYKKESPANANCDKQQLINNLYHFMTR